MLSPLRLLLLLAIGAWLAQRRGWRRLRWLCGAAAVLALVLTTPLGANALVGLHDANGKLRVSITLDSKGDAEVRIFDKNGYVKSQLKPGVEV